MHKPLAVQHEQELCKLKPIKNPSKDVVEVHEARLLAVELFVVDKVFRDRKSVFFKGVIPGELIMVQ